MARRYQAKGTSPDPARILRTSWRTSQLGTSVVATCLVANSRSSARPLRLPGQEPTRLSVGALGPRYAAGDGGAPVHQLDDRPYRIAEFGRDLCSGCACDGGSRTPCPQCGGHRDPRGSAHIGDLCWQCAEEQQPPCASCGTRLSLARNEGDICWPCRVNRHFHLPERTSRLNTR